MRPGELELRHVDVGEHSKASGDADDVRSKSTMVWEPARSMALTVSATVPFMVLGRQRDRLPRSVLRRYGSFMSAPRRLNTPAFNIGPYSQRRPVMEPKEVYLGS